MVETEKLRYVQQYLRWTQDALRRASDGLERLPQQPADEEYISEQFTLAHEALTLCVRRWCQLTGRYDILPAPNGTQQRLF